MRSTLETGASARHQSRAKRPHQRCSQHSSHVPVGFGVALLAATQGPGGHLGSPWQAGQQGRGPPSAPSCRPPQPASSHASQWGQPRGVTCITETKRTTHHKTHLCPQSPCLLPRSPCKISVTGKRGVAAGSEKAGVWASSTGKPRDAGHAIVTAPSKACRAGNSQLPGQGPGTLLKREAPEQTSSC